MARWLSWLERRPVTAEVDGSNPFRVVIAKNHFRRSDFFVLFITTIARKSAISRWGFLRNFI